MEDEAEEEKEEGLSLMWALNWLRSHVESDTSKSGLISLLPIQILRQEKGKKQKHWSNGVIKPKLEGWCMLFCYYDCLIVD